MHSYMLQLHSTEYFYWQYDTNNNYTCNVDYINTQLKYKFLPSKNIIACPTNYTQT